MIDRKLIREKFLKMREEEESKKKQIQDEINNQNNEIELMKYEDRFQKRILFYEKIKVNKLDMYVEYLFDTQNE